MNFLKKLFGGAGRPSDRASYFYVRPKRCDEILQVRIDLFNDASLTDSGEYYVRKLVRGARCPLPAELHVYLNANRQLVRVEVQDGEQVSAEDYEAWAARRDSRPHTS